MIFFRYFFVVEEFHIERTFALGHGAQDGDVVFHFCQRDLGFNDDDAFAVAMVFHAEDAAAAAAEVAHDIAHVIFRDDDVDVVIGSRRIGFASGTAFFNAWPAATLKAISEESTDGTSRQSG